eukprot:m.955731 g.955731  ORF g.955731 m.955731 type:complete len:206 (-) comp23872_c0_seq14:4048-4665(-)
MIISNNDVIVLAAVVSAVLVACIYVYVYIYRRGKSCFDEPKVSYERHRSRFETSPLLLMTRRQGFMRYTSSRAERSGVKQNETSAPGDAPQKKKPIYEDSLLQPEASLANDWLCSTAFNGSADHCTYCGHPETSDGSGTSYPLCECRPPMNATVDVSTLTTYTIPSARSTNSSTGSGFCAFCGAAGSIDMSNGVCLSCGGKKPAL